MRNTAVKEPARQGHTFIAYLYMVQDVTLFGNNIGGDIIKLKWYYTGLGCVCMRVQLCPTPCDSMDCSPPGSSVHGIFQIRILKWVIMLSSRGSSWPRDQTESPVSPTLAGGFFTHWAIREGPQSVGLLRFTGGSPFITL